jgi:hypothetical protein
MLAKETREMVRGVRVTRTVACVLVFITFSRHLNTCTAVEAIVFAVFARFNFILALETSETFGTDTMFIIQMGDIQKRQSPFRTTSNTKVLDTLATNALILTIQVALGRGCHSRLILTLATSKPGRAVTSFVVLCSTGSVVGTELLSVVGFFLGAPGGRLVFAILSGK